MTKTVRFLHVGATNFSAGIHYWGQGRHGLVLMWGQVGTLNILHTGANGRTNWSHINIQVIHGVALYSFAEVEEVA